MTRVNRVAFLIYNSIYVEGLVCQETSEVCALIRLLAAKSKSSLSFSGNKYTSGIHGGESYTRVIIQAFNVGHMHELRREQRTNRTYLTAAINDLQKSVS